MGGRAIWPIKMSKRMSEKSGEHRSIAFGVVDGLASNANETGHTSFESRVIMLTFLFFYVFITLASIYTAHWHSKLS